MQLNARVSIQKDIGGYSVLAGLLARLFGFERFLNFQGVDMSGEKPDTDTSKSGVLTRLLAKTPLEQRIVNLIQPVTEGMGFELVRVRLTGSRRPVLQVMAERPDGGIDVDDCAEISHTLSALLDVEDPIEGEYVLEVSSPGVDRPLTRLKDFERYAGFEAKLELAEAIEGRKRFRGILAGADLEKNTVALDVAEFGELEFEAEWLAEAKLILTDDLVRASLKAAKIGSAADGAEMDVTEAEDMTEAERTNLDEEAGSAASYEPNKD